VEEKIVFSHVGFAYPGGDEVFSDLSFEIPAGKITAITGPSGAGKSTVADLLLGLIEPQAGEILVDGRRLGPGEQRAWRGQVAYVPQEVMLIYGSVFDNLRIAAPGADEGEMWAALRAANALDFVAALPDGGHTLIGERGARLSGGQRQRVALARALLRKPDLLVLDEALNALDRENETAVLTALRGLRGEMMVVLITHQAESLRIADGVLELGRLGCGV
jgi:ATP-binding cassette subfamily C protein